MIKIQKIIIIIIYLIILHLLASVFLLVKKSKINSMSVYTIVLLYISSYFLLIILIPQIEYDLYDSLILIIPLIYYVYFVLKEKYIKLGEKIIFSSIIILLFLLFTLISLFNSPFLASVNDPSNLPESSTVSSNNAFMELFSYVLNSNHSKVTIVLLLILVSGNIVGNFTNQRDLEAITKMIIIIIPIFLIINSLYDISIAAFIEDSKLTEMIGSQYFTLIIYIMIEIIYYYILTVVVFSVSLITKRIAQNLTK